MRRDGPKAFSETSQFARLEQFVSARSSRKLHDGQLQKKM
jgi:hypothetical protein